MRYAVVSDLHANLQAWNAVLTDIAAQRCDRILCLGDSIGYGPNPSEVLESAYRHIDGFCIGNHDAVVCGKLDPVLFNDHARRLLDWTRSRLTGKAVRFLAAQPLTLAGPGFRCVHGDFTDPAAFNYVEDAAAASSCWDAAREPLLFTGHTHVPALFVIGGSGTTHHLQPQNFVLEAGKRYLVNPGSAGNPRGGDAIASYCIFDGDERSVVWRTVPFDLDACRAALIAAGFSEKDTPFLRNDPRRRLTAVREEVCFSPARTAGERARDVTPVSELDRLSRAARRWKRIALAAGVAGVLSFGAGLGVLLMRPPGGPLMLPSGDLPVFTPVSRENILPPFPGFADGAGLAGWRLRLDNPRGTSISAEPGGPASGGGITVAVAGAPARFRIESPPIRVRMENIEKFILKLSMPRAPDFKGTVLFAVEQLGGTDGGVHPVLVRETKDPPPKSPTIRFTTDNARISPAARFVRFAIEGEYSGSATFIAPVLEPVLRPAAAMP